MTDIIQHDHIHRQEPQFEVSFEQGATKGILGFKVKAVGATAPEAMNGAIAMLKVAESEAKQRQTAEK
jgi:hypothetical protein